MCSSGSSGTKTALSLKCSFGVFPERRRGSLEKEKLNQSTTAGSGGHTPSVTKRPTDNVLLYECITDALRARSNRQITPIHDSDHKQAEGGGHLFPIGAVEPIP